MRFFAYIFSFYLLAIFALPCNDGYNDCKTTSAVIAADDDHSHKTDHNDICSPFCTCSCCSTAAGFSYHSLKIKEAKPGLFKTQKIPLRNFSLTSDYYGNIWQPPKLIPGVLLA